jgi:SAM-dependent methyltransferase
MGFTGDYANSLNKIIIIMDERLQKDFERFKNLSFDDFKQLAKDESLSIYQKIGFPDEYRKGKEEFILNDIIKKLDIQNAQSKVLLDIGIGCSDLAKYIIHLCRTEKMTLLAVDSKEMLDNIEDAEHVEKYYGYFPDQMEELINKYSNNVDFIICYSIFHYVFYNTCSYRFLDIAVSLLKPGGKLLLADLPNISKRKRFFSSDTGILFHQKFTKTDTLPELKYLGIEPSQIDDGVVFGILQRYRNFGYETYLLQQNQYLPMANRREDILIVRN